MFQAKVDYLEHRSKNKQFLWTEKLINKFYRLKELFCQAEGPVRRYPIPPGDPLGRLFVLHIDFSVCAIAGILHRR